MKIYLRKIIFITFYLVIGTYGIFGGKDASDLRYRYIASLRRANKHFCSGSIIDKYHIVTAAHCIKNKWKYEITIVAGTTFRRARDGDYYYVLNMMVHEDNMKMAKHPTITWHDIALIRVTREIHIYDKVKPVALPMIDQPKENDNVAVAGWGLVDPSGWVPLKLKELHQRISNIDHCRAMYPVWTNHICLYSIVGEGTCNGDSGGPIVIPGGENGENDVLVGVASFVLPPCGAYPNFAAKVFSYIDWIEATKQKLLNQNSYLNVIPGISG